MTRTDRLLALLTEQLAPLELEVIDESAQHAGHAGAAPGGETHYRLRIKSAQLAGLSRVEQHRKVYTILASELQNGLHALAIEVIT